MALPSMSIMSDGYHSLREMERALVVSRKNPFMRYVARKLEGRQREKGINTKMRVKLAAKMLVIAWTLMKKKEAFNQGCIG